MSKRDYSLPSLDELNTLQNAASVMNSSIQMMQLEELHREITVTASTDSCKSLMRTLKDVIMSIPESDIHVAAGEVVLGLKLKETNKGCSFKFSKPSRIDLVGSFLLNTNIPSRLNCDIALEIPEICFATKDFLNYRYFEKRACYLEHIALQIKSKLTELSCNMDIVFPFTLLQPVLNITTVNSEFSLRVFCTVGKNIFPIQKLRPDRNCVRPLVDPASDTKVQFEPTPAYNNIVLSEMSFRSHQTRVFDYISSHPEACKAITLFKLWIYQLELTSFQRVDGVPSHLFPLIFTSLLRGNTLQMLRLVWKWICDFDVSKPFFIDKVTEDVAASPISIVLDGVNIASSIAQSVFLELQYHAKNALTILDVNSSSESISDIFVRKINFVSRFDSLLRIPSDVFKNEDFYESIIKVENILKKAYGDRIKSIICSAVTQPKCSFDLKRKISKINFNLPLEIMFGLRLTDNHARVIELGPSANDPSASAFRAFWGNSELRRFPDGRVLEAVIFSSDPMGSIAKKVLKLHASINEHDIFYVQDQLLKAIPFSLESHQNDVNVFRSTFTELKSKISTLNELPLSVINVWCLNSCYHSSSVIAKSQFLDYSVSWNSGESESELFNFQSKLANRIDCIDVLIQFESSSSWPDDIIAVNRIKTAFYIKMGDLLSSENTFCIPAESWLDVFFRSRVWRIKIFHKREMYLATLDGIDSTQLQNLHTILPTHHSAMHQVQSQFPLYGATACVIKHWFNSHLFSSFFSNEIVDLLAIIPFTRLSTIMPQTVQAAFISWLQVISRIDFATTPIILSDPEQSDQEFSAFYSHVMSEFAKARAKDTSDRILWIASKSDPVSASFTKNGPSLRILRRLSSYALSTLNSIENLISSTDNYLQWATLFKTPLKNYDIFIILNECVLGSQKISQCASKNDVKLNGSKFKQPPVQLVQDNNNDIEFLRCYAKNYLVGFNCVEVYLEALSRSFGDYCDFFVNRSCPKYIAVKFIKDTVSSKGLCISEEVAFTVSNSSNSKPVKSKDRFMNCKINLDQFEFEMIRLGFGIVDDVVIGYENFKKHK